MAFGDLVKSLVVRFTSENWELVKAEIDDIPDEKKVKVDVDTSALSGDMGAAINDLGRRMENALGNAGSGGGKSFLAGFASSLGGTPFSGLQGILSTPIAGPIVLVGIVAAVAALATEILGVVSGFAAAGQGVAAFGALAYPTFSAISGGLTTIQAATAKYNAAVGDKAKDAALKQLKADWAALDPVQRTAVRNVLALETQFDSLAKKFEPLLAPIINTLTGKGGIISQILQDLPPFADAAAKAITPLVTQFDKFLKSPGAQQFQNTMVQIEKLAIPAIGQGIGQVAVQIGKLLTLMSAKDDARAIKIAFDIIAGAINAVRVAIEGMMKAWDWISRTGVPQTKRALADVGDAVDAVIHWFDRMGTDAVHDFETAYRAVASFNAAVHRYITEAGSVIARFFTVDIPHWISEAVTWFEQLPNKIILALSSLASMLFTAGQNAMKGLISGLASMIGAVGSTVAGIAKKVAGFFGLSPAVEGPLSGSGAPEIRGAHFAEAFAAGMAGKAGVVAAAAHGVAGAAGVGAAGGGLYAAGGAGDIVLHLNVNQQQLMQWIHTGLLTLKRNRGFTPSTGAGLGLA